MSRLLDQLRDRAGPSQSVWKRISSASESKITPALTPRCRGIPAVICSRWEPVAFGSGSKFSTRLSTGKILSGAAPDGGPPLASPSAEGSRRIKLPSLECSASAMPVDDSVINARRRVSARQGFECWTDHISRRSGGAGAGGPSAFRAFSLSASETAFNEPVLSERELVSSLVFDVIDMLKRDMVARAAIDIIDRDQSMVALRECDVVIRLRCSINHQPCPALDYVAIRREFRQIETRILSNIVN